MIVYKDSESDSMTEMNDRNLMDAYRGGDSQAFETLVRRYGPTVLGYLIKMTQNKDQAEDLFQETFQRVHRHAGQFRGQQLMPWLLAIATRTAISQYRKDRRTPAVSLDRPVCGDGTHCPALQDTLAADTAEPPDRLQQQEQGRRVRESLMRLPDRQRAALVLSYYHKQTHRQIAEAMGCSVGAVKTHIFRALKKLRTLLPEETGVIG